MCKFAKFGVEPVSQAVLVPCRPPFALGCVPVVAPRAGHRGGQPELAVWRLRVEHKGAARRAEADGKHALRELCVHALVGSVVDDINDGMQRRVGHAQKRAFAPRRRVFWLRQRHGSARSLHHQTDPRDLVTKPPPCSPQRSPLCVGPFLCSTHPACSLHAGPRSVITARSIRHKPRIPARAHRSRPALTSACTHEPLPSQPSQPIARSATKRNP
mmetsp:Transcript_2862/g.7865  ORF Transcript_2862/g.7865 Transcript_2862/m.7865 type:complete len:215 (+) Transcript_2862:1266-1910(+)